MNIYVYNQRAHFLFSRLHRKLIVLIQGKLRCARTLHI